MEGLSLHMRGSRDQGIKELTTIHLEAEALGATMGFDKRVKPKLKSLQNGVWPAGWALGGGRGERLAGQRAP